MKNKSTLLIIINSVLLSCCTPVRFYSDADLTKKTGLKFYPVRPFMQIERETETGRIVKATLLYLPDLSNPQYMAIKSGPGAAKADLKLADGILTNFGFEYEQILPESLESLATLVSKTAAAAEDISGMKANPALKSAPNIVELYEVIMTGEKTTFREVTPVK
jgi:hypothetical protein